jgi:acyl-CoA thioester hydrolase
MQHVNHATYLTFMETARLEYYEYLGFESRNWDHIEGTILGSMTVYYHQQVLHPAQLDIGQRISRVGHKSFDILTGIFVAEQDIPALTATFTVVSFNYKNNTTIPVPDKIRDKCREL